MSKKGSKLFAVLNIFIITGIMIGNVILVYNTPEN